MSEPKLIKSWKELAEVPDSKTHRLKIRECNGHIYRRNSPSDGLLGRGAFYLSTHTFYGSQYERSTKILQDCGFNVRLANWDEGSREEEHEIGY